MTQIKGYTKKDGTFVKPHQDKRSPLKQLAHDFLKKHAPHLVSLFDGDPVDEDQGPPPSGGLQEFKEPKKPHYPNAVQHPQPGEKGEPIQINEPSTPTPEASWTDPTQVATFAPGGPVPESLNGIPFKSWDDAPSTPEEWDEVPGQDLWLDEPEFESLGKPAAGVVVEEPDGRVWVIHPTNGFGGYRATFPKGRIEHDINLQASAIKEAFEESGLQVEITGHLMDVERSVTTARYYTARRVGGTPKDMGWESQAVSLVPRSKLYEVLNSYNDHGLAEALGAGPRPPKPEKPKWEPKPGQKPSGNWSGGSSGLPKPSTTKPSLPPPILKKKDS